MSESTDWRDHDNGMTVADRLTAMAKAGYDVTGPMGEIARVCSVAAALRQEKRLAWLKANYDELVVLLDPDGSAGDDHEEIKREALVMFGKLAAIQEERDRMKAAQIAREGLDGKQ